MHRGQSIECKRRQSVHVRTHAFPVALEIDASSIPYSTADGYEDSDDGDIQ